MEKLKNPILKWVKWRIKRNKNCILIINGGTGSGKTYSGATLACDVASMLGTSFTAENNIDFTFKGLLQKMELPQNKKAGTPFLFEEVGAVGGGAASRDWQSKANKFFFSFMQTARHRNQVLIFTCPSFAALEKETRLAVQDTLVAREDLKTLLEEAGLDKVIEKTSSELNRLIRQSLILGLPGFILALSSDRPAGRSTDEGIVRYNIRDLPIPLAGAKSEKILVSILNKIVEEQLSGDTVGRIRSNLTLARKAALELEESLDPLVLSPLILATRCALCPV